MAIEATQNLSRRMLQELDDFVAEIDNDHMVWLKEIEQAAYLMFSGESNTEPELMPKTPSQKRRPRMKRISMALQEEARTRRRFSKGRRSNLAASSEKRELDLVLEEVMEPQSSTSSVAVMEPQPSTSEGMGSVSLEVVDEEQPPLSTMVKAEPVEQATDMNENRRVSITLAKAVVRISVGDRRSAEAARPPQLMAIVKPEPSSPDCTAASVASPDRTAASVASPDPTAASVASPGRTATAEKPTRPRVSLTLRHSAAGLRHSLTRESVRRASRRSLLKKVKARTSSSTCSEDTPAETEDEDEHQPEELSEAPEVFAETEEPEVVASGSSNSVTRASSRSAVANSRSHTADAAVVQAPVRASRSTKRKPEEHADSSQKKVVKPNMKSFLQTVQRNQMLTPNTLGRSAVMKSFIKHNTPLKVDMVQTVGVVAKERQKLEVLKKKQEQEEERLNKMEEEKRRKQEDLKRKREERLKKAADARAKEELKAEEKKKKKMEEKRVQLEEKNEKLRIERLAEEKLKKQLSLKHQEEIDSRRKLEEETRLKKIQQAEEEKRQQALQAKRRAEEEEEAHRAHKLAEARRAQERAERERAEALQREVEKAAREERKEAEEKEQKEAEKRALEDQMKKEEQQRLAEEERAANHRLAEAAAKMQPLGPSASCINVTMDVESSLMKSPAAKGGPAGMNETMDVPQSPQTYVITPKGGNKTVKLTGNADDYGMDQNSDDSTDDESAPRKPIPSWAEGQALQQVLLREYFNPPDLHALFGTIAPPNLEEIFYTKKPRYNKRTSSAVWHSPPMAK